MEVQAEGSVRAASVLRRGPGGTDVGAELDSASIGSTRSRA